MFRCRFALFPRNEKVLVFASPPFTRRGLPILSFGRWSDIRRRVFQHGFLSLLPMLAKYFELFRRVLLDGCFLGAGRLHDGVKEFDLVLVQSAELVLQFKFLFESFLLGHYIAQEIHPNISACTTMETRAEQESGSQRSSLLFCCSTSYRLFPPSCLPMSAFCLRASSSSCCTRCHSSSCSTGSSFVPPDTKPDDILEGCTARTARWNPEQQRLSVESKRKRVIQAG